MRGKMAGRQAKVLTEGQLQAALRAARATRYPERDRVMLLLSAKAGMRAAEIRGKHLGRPATQQRIIREIETLATSTNLSIRQIQSKIAGRVSRGIVGEVTKRARAVRLEAL